MASRVRRPCGRSWSIARSAIATIPILLAAQDTIERGKLADLLILDADPLADIRNISKIHLVIKAGVANN